MNSDYKQWNFEDAQVGDKVFITQSHIGGFRMEVATIEKVLKIHVVVAGTKYRKDGGQSVGSYHYGSCIKKYNQEDWDEYQADREKKAKRRVVTDYDWKACPDQVIEQVYSMLHPTQKG